MADVILSSLCTTHTYYTCIYVLYIYVLPFVNISLFQWVGSDLWSIGTYNYRLFSRPPRGVRGVSYPEPCGNKRAPQWHIMCCRIVARVTFETDLNLLRIYYTCQWPKSRNNLHTSSTKVIQNDQMSCLSYLVQRFITFSVSVSCARPIPPVDARYVSDSWLSCLVPLLEFNDDAEDIYRDDISILFCFTYYYNIVVRLPSAVTGVALPSRSKSLLVSCYVDL